MGVLDTLVGVGTALGRGVISVAEDLYYGAERTAEGLGVRGWDRTAEIGLENEYLVKLLTAMVKGVVSDAANPLFRLISKILEKYYDQFPPDVLEKLAKAAAIGAGYMAGRMLIGKKLAEVIAVKIATQIAATAAYKQLATKIGVSAAAGSTGVGVVITLVMVQGVGQRASKASQRLRSRNPALWQDLRRLEGLDMLYFLVEGPMAPHMDAIDMAHRNRPLFEKEVQKLYQNFNGR
jgi:hypothetical protein